MRSSCEIARSAYAQKSRRNGVDRRFVDREAGRRFVAAVADEVLAAGRERGVQIEAVDAAAGAHRPASRPARRAKSAPWADDTARPAGRRRCRSRPACQPRPASTRAGASCGSPVSCGQLVGGPVHAPLQRLPLIVEAVNELGQLARPLWVLGRQQLDGQRRLAQPAGRVEPRGDREADVLAIELRVSCRGRSLARAPARPGVG